MQNSNELVPDVKRHFEETFGFFGGGGNTTSWRFTDLTRVSSWCIWALTIAADDKLVISKIHLQDFAVGYVTGDRDAVNKGFKFSLNITSQGLGTLDRIVACFDDEFAHCTDCGDGSGRLDSTRCRFPFAAETTKKCWNQ